MPATMHRATQTVRKRSKNGRLDQHFVDREDLRLLAIEHRLHSERETEIAGADINPGDAGHVQDPVEIVERFLRLDHRDHQHLVIGDGLIGGALAVSARADRPIAATALGGIETRVRQCLGFGRRVDHRADHAPGAGIEHLADDARLVPRHPHHRGDGVAIHRLVALDQRQIVLHAVLHIDGDAVEAALRHYLRRKASRNGKPRVNASLTGFQSRPELIHAVVLGSFVGSSLAR